MNTGKIILIVIVALVLMIGMGAYSSYNSMVSLDEGVGQQWSNVENAYQLRADKTKNLVEIVKGAADFEKETLTGVIEARSNATKVQVDANDLSAENIQQFQQAQDKFSSALSRLLVTVERYPELKAVKGFQDFQAQYEGMENRIGVERRKYNESAKNMNTKIKKLPGKLYNMFFGFEEKGYFEATEGSEEAPDISFE